MNLLLVLIPVVVIPLAIWYAIYSANRERKRLTDLANWAAENNFQFFQDDPFNLDGRFNGVGDIGQGHARRAFEVLYREQPVPTWLFRYQFRTWETRITTDSNGQTRTGTYEQTQWRSFAIIELASAFPKLFIRPENMFDKVAAMAGFDDINFESEEFSRKFFCKSDNREFAYAVIQPQMMDWMLGLCAANMRFEGQLYGPLFVSHLDKLPNTAEGRKAALTMMSGFLNRIPQFVWQDYGKRTPVQLPDAINIPDPQPTLTTAGQQPKNG
jgi:hypothetical protein